MSLGQFIWSIDKDTITSQRQNYQKGGQYKRDSNKEHFIMNGMVKRAGFYFFEVNY